MNGRYEVVTWQEMVDFAATASRARGRPIGLAPELKHSTHARSLGLPLEERFLDTLGHSFLRRCPLVVQSFEISNLKFLRSKLGRRDNLRLMQLIDPARQPADVAKAGASLTSAQMMEVAGLRDVARYADILAPDTRSVIPLGPDKRLLSPSPVTALAHRAGLAVMPYTFRPENYFLAADFQDGLGPAARNSTGSVAEMRVYLAAGIDGFFTDDPKLGRQAADRT
jgi:glycerophosphoryl diester phosphodiesterase